jgi:hypothetical protein
VGYFGLFPLPVEPHFGRSQTVRSRAVNLSGVSFRRHDRLKSILATLEATGVAAEHLELEVTEGVVIHDVRKVLPGQHRLPDGAGVLLLTPVASRCDDGAPPLAACARDRAGSQGRRAPRQQHRPQSAGFVVGAPPLTRSGSPDRAPWLEADTVAQPVTPCRQLATWRTTRPCAVSISHFTAAGSLSSSAA